MSLSPTVVETVPDSLCCSHVETVGFGSGDGVRVFLTV